MQLKTMTFNVRGSFNDDGENAWEKRRATKPHSKITMLWGLLDSQSGQPSLQ